MHQPLKEIDDRVAEYLRVRLKNECAKYGEQARISKATGFSQATLSKIRNGRGDPGARLFRALADYWGTTTQDIEAEVLAPSINADDPYPSRARVIEQLRAYFPVDVLEAIASIQLPPDARDPGAIWWSQFAHTLLERLGAKDASEP